MYVTQLPLFPYLQRNHISDLFCSNISKVYGSSGDSWILPADNGIKMMGEKKLQFKSELLDSTIFPGLNNTKDSYARFFHPSLDVNGITLDVNGIKAKTSVSNIYNGCFHRISNPKVQKLPTSHLHISSNILFSDGISKSFQTTNIKQHENSTSRIYFTNRSFKTKNKVEYKPYTCITCSKKFKQKCHLNRHQRMHTGVKRFFCLTCNHGFYQRSNLRAHVRTHARDETISHSFACTICTKRYTRKHSLTKHLERHSKGLIRMSRD